MRLTKKDIAKLSSLSRVSLKGEEDKLLKDLEEILEHFSVLNEVNTDSTEPLLSGGGATNVFRADGGEWPYRGLGNENFISGKNDWMQIPPVFE